MQLQIVDQFRKDLHKYRSDKSVEKLIRRYIKLVEEAKTLNEIPNLEPLNPKPYYKIKTPPWRFGIKIEGSVVIFMRFLNRGDNYKGFPPKK